MASDRPAMSEQTDPLAQLILDHPFKPVAGHTDDDECTFRSDGTDDTYCGQPEHRHETSER